jgi:hypothetical protein
MDFRKYLSEAELAALQPSVGDELDISINDLINIETEVLESSEDGITIALDERALEILEACGCGLEDEAEVEQVDEAHLTRQYDLHLLKDMGDGYYLAAEDHSDDDVRKVTHVVYYLEDPRGLEDKFAPVWRFVGYLKTSPYNPRSEDVIAAAKAVIAKDTGAEQSESVVEDVVAHKTHGAVYGKDGKAKLFMTRSEAEQVADAMAAKHKGKTGISVIQGPFTGYLVKMPESEQTDEAGNLGSGMKKYKFWYGGNTDLGGHDSGDPRSIKKNLEKSGPEFTKKIASNPDPKLRGQAELQRRIAQKMTKEEEEIDEAGMPSSVIKHKQDMAEKTPEELYARFKNVAERFGPATPAAMEKLAREMAWRHGYGKMSDHYWKQFKHLVGESVAEAEYQGRQVQLGKPMKGDVKKFKVYVRAPNGNIKKVNFGDPNMEIKRDNPERRKNFRARHNCSSKKDRTKAGYWSCRMWSKKPVSKIV